MQPEPSLKPGAPGFGLWFLQHEQGNDVTHPFEDKFVLGPTALDWLAGHLYLLGLQQKSANRHYYIAAADGLWNLVEFLNSKKPTP